MVRYSFIKAVTQLKYNSKACIIDFVKFIMENYRHCLLFRTLHAMCNRCQQSSYLDDLVTHKKRWRFKTKLALTLQLFFWDQIVITHPDTRAAVNDYA